MWRTRVMGAAVLTLAVTAPAGAQPRARLNPLVPLHQANTPVFGLYAPAPGGGRAREGAPAPPVKTPAERATETLSQPHSDYIFDGSMERGVEPALPAFAEYVAALRAAGTTARRTPLMVKTARIADDAALAQRMIARQLDTGVSGIVFVEVESAEELRTGLAAMRFRANGGTRPDAVGAAPAYWGVDEATYRARADLWPLDPAGELVAWVIVESRAGLDHLDEIAQVPGIGALFPGAGTLRGVFTTTNAAGERVFDAEGWERAIQKVLAACKANGLPCGYPANADDVVMRMEQGFSVFVIGWGENGFRTVDIGRRHAGR